ncbi:hypothetical protein SEVIR_9G327000v4 [Setaria viridis]|uniref:Aminotransferase-like plant mobile domain-containing protein n=1 Tax=Setaria viridis TaxID=4556 RepID=A0A4U6T0E5_SETVI|nr:uncharacterized protein LOC117836044 [Setaria viridis]XP_034571290.1 uncharacterized protein LOC117836044 [Setaria viridis]XP_034571291.1 uncharacterized protein LOC117836044 [Setaria viridis]XP_034571292.1 uncharacterized protein LOC117836044 [Setaria viridis]XP_034571293.1 uncharacterized protein LOC117836044 [Setaria viridis]XP_034571294.1 uncharacterized protein LOC117836044 [Setaria viridis]TKV94909.1 hypothetical protein SEVIR_9G327000v2 [Setaria viridis]
MGRAGFKRKCRSSNRNAQADKEPRNRASPIRIVRLYPHLTPDQRKMIEDAGFGGLLKIGCPTFPLGFCGWLLRRFDTDYCELVIKGRGRIPVTSDSVHRVLGIPNGGGDVKYGLDEDAMAFMSDKLDASGKYWPTVSSIENSLKQMKSADEHFLRTFMVLVISSFLCPTTSLRISPRCFPPLVDIKSIRELNWCKFVVEQLRKSVRAFARKGKNSVPGCLFYLVILYLDSLDTRDMQIPHGTPRISAWNKKLVNKVLEMDMKDNGSFGKCLLKKRAPDSISSRGASGASAILGGVPEIANFVSANVAAGYNAQKKEVLSNAVGKLCASITNALSKFMHEVSALEVTCGEVTRDRSPALVENNNVNNVEENASRDEEDVLPEDSSELPTEDTEDTSADEYEDQSSVDGSSRDDDSEDDPDWEQDELNSSKQKRVRTEPGDGAAKSEKGTGEGSGHDSDTPKGNQETGNGRTDDHANLKKRTLACVDGGTSEARSARQKTGEKSGVAVEKTAVQTPSSPLHGGGRPCNSGPRLCDDGRTFKVKEEMEKTPVIDLCTPTSSESDCAVLKTADPSSPVDGPKRAS